MFLLAAAANPVAQNANTIINLIDSFLPLNTLSTVVDQVMPVFNVIGAFLIIIATVQEIPKSHGADLLNVILRGAIALLVMSIITSLMWDGEVLAQGIVRAISANVGNGVPFVKNPVAVTPIGQVPDAVTRSKILYDFGFAGLLDGMKVPQAQGGGFNIVDDAKFIIEVVIFGVIGLVALFTVFVMTLMLYLQKAILIFSRFLMPPFIGLLTWQGSTRFLGVNYIQSVLGVTCWPIGWGFIHIGTAAALQKLQALVQQFQQSTNGNIELGLLIFILINVILVCLWMVIGTVMAPGLIMKVITAGGHFAASAMGAVSGKAVGAAGDTIKGATQAGGMIAGAAAGLALTGGNPQGAQIGGQIGGQLGGSVGGVAAAPASSMESSISQATGEGSGAGGQAMPSNASSAAGLAALAQMGKPQGGSGGQS